MPEADRIYNPSRQTSSILDQAASIGPNARKLCELLFQEQGRTGHRKMRGVVGLTRHFKASLIEEASRLSLERKVYSSHAVKEIVKRLDFSQKKQNVAPVLVQTHPLIREPEQYEMFWRQHAVQQSLFEEEALSSSGDTSDQLKENNPCP